MNSSIHTPDISPQSSSFEDISSKVIPPPPLMRQTNKPRCLTYQNGVLVDQDGNPTTPEKHNTTHAEILHNIRKHRHLCFKEDDDELLALFAKYVPESSFHITQ